jgi:predicted metal-dependent enzyme (double-stranded beta helix superfamily)
MDANQRRQARTDAVNAAVEQIREIQATDGVNRESLARFQQILMDLAAQSELFPLSDFPPPDPSASKNNAMYRLSEDEDHQFALYAQLCQGGNNTPAHNHTTWAVIVGLQGEELNRLYAPDEANGVRETSQYMVKAGTGIAFMPEDLHSIHIDGDEPVLNFHMYGLGLEQLEKRRYYKQSTKEWLHFPASEGIADLPAVQ